MTSPRLNRKEIKAHPELLLELLSPYIGKVVVGVECTHCWYWVSDYCYAKELSQVEYLIEQQAKQHQPVYLQLLRSIPGIGRILALTILYEIGGISRFETVQKFASYSRLVKCKAESAGKSYGTQGNKIGNAHLRWAFSEGAVLYLRGNPKAQKYMQRLQKRMNKAKALSALAHKLGRAIFFMLKHRTDFDEKRFLTG